MKRIDLSDRKTYRQEKERAAQTQTLTLPEASPGGNGRNGGIPSSLSVFNSSASSHASADDWATQSFPPFSPPLPARTHPVPEDSAIARYRDVMRGISEAPDSWLVAPILAVAARLLTPAVQLDFGGYKPLTLFQFIAGPAGLRKSTSVNPALRIASLLLPPKALLVGNASDSALFDSFEKEPHRLQMEDEGNTIIRTWGSSHYGREVAGRYLKLYDGQSWGQNFRREATEHMDKEAERRIDRASLSLVIASTFGVSRFDGVDAASGLRRRFGYYVEEASARRIDWPAAFGDAEAEKLADLFRPLTTLSGTIGRSFAPGAWEVWQEIQRANRDACATLSGATATEEAAGAALNESPMRILKLAVIFQACRWLTNPSLDPLELNAEVLRIAHAHQQDCLAAAAELDTLGRRVGIADAADSIIARIRSDFAGLSKDGWILLNRTQLTNKFAQHSERANALTSTRLYTEIIPHLIRQGKARQIPQKGKKYLYGFTGEE